MSIRRKLWDLIDKGETWEIKTLDVPVFEKQWENIFSGEKKRQRKGCEVIGYRQQKVLLHKVTTEGALRRSSFKAEKLLFGFEL